MRPELYALLGASFAAALSIYYRIFMRNRSSAWALTLLTSLFGFVFLSALLPVSWPSSLRSEEVAALILGNVAWTLMVYFDTRSYEELDVSLNHLMDSARLVVLILCGVYLFGESPTVSHYLGMALIISSILYGVTLKGIKANRGARYRAASLAFGTLGMLSDKFLTTRLDLNFVIVIAYFLPIPFILIARPKTALELWSESTKHGISLATACIIYALLGWSIISAIGSGDLGASTAIYQSKMVFALILGALILGEREEVRRRIGAIGLCAVGVVVICFG